MTMDTPPIDAGLPLAERVAARIEESKPDESKPATHFLRDVARVDLGIYRAVAATSTPSMDGPIRRLSELADHSKIWLAIAALMAIGGGPRGRRAAADGIAAVAVSSVIVNTMLKLVAKRSRPERLAAGVPTQRHVSMPRSGSFPSGHSASAFAFATGVARTLPTEAIPIRLLASLVAYSRVHTGVHYPGDVIIGALIGTTIAECVTQAGSLLDSKPSSNAVVWERNERGTGCKRSRWTQIDEEDEKEDPMTSILMVLTSHDQLGTTGRKTGWYLPEAAHPWKVFTEAGFDLAWTSPLGGYAQMDGVDRDDTVQTEFLDTFGELGPKTTTTASVDASRFDAIFYVGGHGAMWDFPGDEHLNRIAMSIYNRGGVVSAVCHGPAGLVNLKLPTGEFLVAGKNVASFSDDEEAAAGLTDVVPFLLGSILEQRGANMRIGTNFEPMTMTDGRLVTGQNPASATGTAEAVVAALAARTSVLSPAS
jgi:putative intracellular protease/amidase/membrane-associated phospholipid phosphatase